MNLRRSIFASAIFCLTVANFSQLKGEDDNSSKTSTTRALTFDELKALGSERSIYRRPQTNPADASVPKPRLSEFRSDIKPVLNNACVSCHGPDAQEGNIRLDTLDPDLVNGEDVSWWVEVLAVVGKGEMPPADADELADADRSRVVEWLTSELQLASQLRRAEGGHSTFRRMTRYEFNHALQDLLGLPFDFARDLPPEADSDDGFQNSSEMLHMTASQLETYRQAAGKALSLATVKGQKPQPIYWGVTMEEASADAWKQQDKERQKLQKQHEDDPEKLKRELEQFDKRRTQRLGATHYRDLSTGRTTRVHWRYSGAKYAWPPRDTQRDIPEPGTTVVVIPPRQRFVVELGDTVPDKGTLRVRVRASRTTNDDSPPPGLQLEFGWQASNDSHASTRVSQEDLLVTATPDAPEWFEWNVPLSQIYPRNSVRGISKMGDLPSPSEFIRIINGSISKGDVQLDYVEVVAPVYDKWPTDSHQLVLGTGQQAQSNETARARTVLTRFLRQALRHHVTSGDIDQKLKLFNAIRSQSDSFETAMVDTLASVLASPQFLYIGPKNSFAKSQEDIDRAFELAERLAMFLWSSIPDEELRRCAADGTLLQAEVLERQTDRMLADERSRRFSKHFVRQWLGMQLLDFLQVDRKTIPHYDAWLKESLPQEPVEFFHDVLCNNASVLDFLHADYTFANERLAQHYGLPNVYGNHFRRVKLEPSQRRGGLLTQAGLLAMNSDGKDSHPLKRGIWLLESILNDPPPPPPPAVPEIDLTDPEILKLSLKERMEDHRNKPACHSCHAKIDPWGIAFENFDAVGRWRTQANGKPVDANSELFSKVPLNGIDGLKRYLLTHRQDQFARALTYKLTTYALGRPLTFGDRAEIDQITSQLRQKDDGLRSLIKLIVTSSLFRPLSHTEISAASVE